MQLAVKKERSLLEILLADGQQSLGAGCPLGSEDLEAYATEGNCIQTAAVVSRGCSKPPLDAPASGTRSYREVANHFGLALEGATVIDVRSQIGVGNFLPPADYFLHTEPLGVPHCVLFRVVAGASPGLQTYEVQGLGLGQRCSNGPLAHNLGADNVWGKVVFDTGDFCKAVDQAADKLNCALFRVGGPIGNSTDVLQGLRAGALATLPVEVALPLVDTSEDVPRVSSDDVAGQLSDSMDEDQNAADLADPTFLQEFRVLLGEEVQQYAARVCRDHTHEAPRSSNFHCFEGERSAILCCFVLVPLRSHTVRSHRRCRHTE